MTNEQLLTTGGSVVPVGLELDALVAEKVMGWTNLLLSDDGAYFRGIHPEYPCIRVGVPDYSTGIREAWEVHLTMCTQIFSVRQRYLRAIQAQARTDDGSLVAWPDVLVALSKNFPEAICRAALDAMEGR